MAMPKPTIVTQKVRQAWPRMVQRCSQVCSTMRHGLGKMNSLTLKTLQISCHSTSVATSRISGAQRSRLLFIGPLRPPRLRPPALRMRADVAAQLVHDVGELRRVGDLQVARARQVDLALDDEAPRALAHHVHRVGQEHAFAQVVRDQDDVELLRRLQVAHRAPQLFAGEGVQRAEGLVQQQHLRLVHQRAADAGALLHAARQLPGELVLVAAQAHALQQLARLVHVLVALGAEAASGRARRSPAAAARCPAWCARAAGWAPGRPCR